LRDAGRSTIGQRFTLALKNNGRSAVRLVLPGDGSEVGWRTPVLAWAATSGGKPVAPVNRGRCGNMNRIERSEIFTLAPGASREIPEWVPSPEFPSGTYDLRLTYRNDPGLLVRKGAAPEDVKRLLASTSACQITTDPIHAALP
jgi:hypothetical protein